MIEQRHNTFVLFGLCKSPIPVWMETGIVRSRMSFKILFLQIFKTAPKIISGSSVQGDVGLPVLIDNFTFLLVNVYALFVANVVLTLVNLNKQTLHLRISGDHLSVLFYATSSFLYFHYKQGRRLSPTCFQNLTKEKKSIKRPEIHVQRTTHILLCFFMSSHILKMFLLYLYCCSSVVFSRI